MAVRAEVRIARAARGAAAPFVRKLVSRTFAAERVRRGVVGVLVTGDAEIRRLNRKFLGHDWATDVISFGADAADEQARQAGYLGDIVVSFATARAFARRLGIPAREELGRYLVHGALHLLGYDDRRPADRRKMHARQEAILKKALS